MSKDYSNQNLQKASFRNEDLRGAIFSGSDLRGADFTASDLSDADFTKARTGISTANIVLLFLAAFIVSMLSGYVAMLAGQTIHILIDSADSKIRIVGFVCIGLVILFILYSLWKGVRTAIFHLIVPIIVIAVIIGVVSYTSGIGTGKGMLFLIVSCALVAIMFIVGTIARAAAGSLSNILFIAVALVGGIFGKSIGGGIASVIMAVSCAVISKRALQGAKGFDFLKKVAASITRKFGTSFRNSRLTNANFSGARLHNADFSNASLSQVNWGDAKKINCLPLEGKASAKEAHSMVHGP
jgi:hypothetical protein